MSAAVHHYACRAGIAYSDLRQMTMAMVMNAFEAVEEQSTRQAWRNAALSRTSKFPKNENSLISSAAKSRGQTIREQYVMAKFLTTVTAGKAN